MQYMGIIDKILLNVSFFPKVRMSHITQKGGVIYE